MIVEDRKKLLEIADHLERLANQVSDYDYTGINPQRLFQYFNDIRTIAQKP